QLPLQQQQELLLLVNRRMVGPPGEVYQRLLTTRIRVDYAPAGSYAWQPVVDRENYPAVAHLPLVAARTPEASLAAARHLRPAAAPAEITPCPGGVFTVTFLYPNGNG